MPLNNHLKTVRLNPVTELSVCFDLDHKLLDTFTKLTDDQITFHVYCDT